MIKKKNVKHMSVVLVGRLVGTLAQLTSRMMRSGPTFKINGPKNVRNSRRRQKNVPKKFVLKDVKSEPVSILDVPVKSESDKKSYKVIRLPNGLTALLISDPRTEKAEKAEQSDSEKSASATDESDEESEEEDEEESGSERGGDSDFDVEESPSSHMENKAAACALCVGVGSYSDPSGIQGMAHFVEHMVFMGSKKYPVENDFDAFIRKKGGADNAQTDCETTTFVFEIQENHLAEGMDRFAQFFVAPLMKQEAMQRERESIESEFALAMPSDSNRKEQLLCATLPAGHPGRTFMWGNYRSLTPPIGPNDDELYRAAHEFQQRHYSAHRMTVAVQARFPLETLEKYVISTFSQIPNNELLPDDFTQYKFSLNTVTPAFNSFYYVKPMMHTSNLTLTWCMRSFLKEYKSKPHHYVSWIIGHEGTGSLLLYLQRKVWALGISSGISDGGIEHTSLMSLFSLSIVLTQEGLENVDQVLDAVFGYINMLKKECPSERIFKEIRDIEDINFKFKDDAQPYDNVEQLSEYMQYLAPEHYMTGQDLYFDYDPDAIMYVINSMSPDTVNVMMQSQNYPEEIQYDQVEEWFGTQYKKTDISSETIKRWNNMKPVEDFHLPCANPFIPNNFDLIPAPPHVLLQKNLKTDDSSDKDNKVQTEVNKTLEAFVYPKLIRNNSLMEVWFKSDHRFDLPYTFVYLYFITPMATESAKSASLMDLWCTALTQLLTEKLYAADVTGLSRSLYTEDKGLTLKLHGFSQKLPIIIDEMTQMLRNYKHRLTRKLFDAIKDVHVKSYSNTIMKPNKLVKEVRLSMLVNFYWPTLEKLKALRLVTYEDLQGFGDLFMDRLYIKMLIQGNLLKEDSLQIADTIENNLKWKALSGDEKPKVLINKVPLGEKHCRVSSFNAADVNSVVTNYYQFGVSDIRNYSIVELIIHLMEEPLFNTLRTKEQLGYNVFCMVRYTSGILGFSVTVNTQAEKYSTGYVNDRIEEFLKEFLIEIQNMPDESFQQSKTALIKMKGGVDVELKDEVRRNWGEIACSEYQFNKHLLEIECLKELTLSDVTAWMESYAISGSDTKRRKLSVQIVGHKPVGEDSKGHVSKKAKMVEPWNSVSNCSIKCVDIPEYPTDCINDIMKFKNSLEKYPEKDDFSLTKTAS